MGNLGSVCVMMGLIAAFSMNSLAASPRPNILWITAEDMSPTLGCYGDEYATTPNLDRLATQSVRYTNAFASAPVCSPSRSCLISGCYATSLGTHQMRSAFAIPESMNGFPALLKQQGFYTTNNVKTDYNTYSADRIIAASWDESSDVAHWRNRSDREQPFFSVFNIMTSHQSRSMVWTQDRFRDEVQAKLSQTEIHDPDTAPVPPYYPDTMVTRRIVSRYYDCVTAMDKRVGQILQQLEEDGLSDSTIVFFYSDHGSGMPRHKRLLHDSGMKVPLMIRFPAKYAHLAPTDAGSTTDRLVSFVDFPATVLDVAGVERPDYMQGIPFLGKDAGTRDYVYGHRDRVDEVIDLSRSVRDKRYLYIRNYMPHLSWNQVSSYPDMSEVRHEFYRVAAASSMSDAQRQYAGQSKPKEELYDCQLDPQNVSNLADSADHREVLQKLRNRMTEFQSTQRDLGFLAESYAWSLFGDKAPWTAAREETGDAKRASDEFRIGQLAANALQTAKLSELLAMLQDENPTRRYWAAIGLAAEPTIDLQTRRLLKRALADKVPSVRIESAHALARHGEVEAVLPSLIEQLEAADLNVVLHATRTIELLGKQAAEARDAMTQVALRADKLQATDTPAVFEQTGERDLAMFCSFSAHGFLKRLDEGPWIELFDGRSLDGWTGYEGDGAKVVGDSIALLSKGKNLWIAHELELDDFELVAETRMPTDAYNAGIGFRCAIADNGRPKGYQCEVAEEESGMLYAIGSGGWVWPRGDEERELYFARVRDAFRNDKWNHFRIRCEGDRVQIWVNGILTTDVRDDKHVRGRIALQHHGKGGIHLYRNVRARSLNE